MRDIPAFRDIPTLEEGWKVTFQRMNIPREKMFTREELEAGK